MFSLSELLCSFSLEKGEDGERGVEREREGINASPMKIPDL